MQMYYTGNTLIYRMVIKGTRKMPLGVFKQFINRSAEIGSVQPSECGVVPAPAVLPSRYTKEHFQ